MADDKQALVDEMRHHHSADPQLMSILDRAATALEGKDKPAPVVEKVPGPGGISDGLNPKVVSIDPPKPQVAVDAPSRPQVAPRPVHFAGRPSNPKPTHRPKGK